MRITPKKLSALLLSFILVLSVTACGQQSTSPAATPESNTPADAPAQSDVTLTYMIDRDTDPTGYEAVMNAFTEKTGVTFEADIRPGGAEGETILKTRLATGDAPDFLWFNAGSLLATLNPEENFVDLSGKAYMDTLQDSYLQTITFEGKSYAIPGQSSQVGGWLYNKKEYEALGLSVPLTWAELMDNCEKIKAAGKAPVIGSYKDSWTAQLILLSDFYNLNAAVPTFAADFDSNKAKYATTPQALRAFEKAGEIYQKGYLNADYLATTYDIALEMLVEGEGVHYPMLTFALSAIMNTFGEEAVNNIGVFGQPGDDANVNGITVWMPSGWSACKTSEHLDEVDRFFEFYLSSEGQAAFDSATRGDGPSVVKDAVLPDNAYAAVKEMMKYYDSGNTAPALEFITSVKGPNSPQICVEVGSGMKTPVESATDYDKDVEKQAKQLGIAGW